MKLAKVPPTPTKDQLLAMLADVLAGDDIVFLAKVEELVVKKRTPKSLHYRLWNFYRIGRSFDDRAERPARHIGRAPMSDEETAAQQACDEKSRMRH